jgi:lactoylglutathione lyase
MTMPEQSEKPEQRIVGVGLHVADLDRSVDFYTNVLGLREVARYQFEGITEVLVGFGEPGESPSIVLVDRADHPRPIDPGNGFDRAMLILDDVRAACERLRAFGCEIVREPDDTTEFPVIIAIARDPDGYGLELLEPRPPSPSPS